MLWWRCWRTQAHIPWTMECEHSRVEERTSSYRHRAAPQMPRTIACWLHTGLSCYSQSSHLPQTAGQMFCICTYIKQIHYHQVQATSAVRYLIEVLPGGLVPLQHDILPLWRAPKTLDLCRGGLLLSSISSSTYSGTVEV